MASQLIVIKYNRKKAKKKVFALWLLQQVLPVSINQDSRLEVT
jgi:hypothetical protein